MAYKIRKTPLNRFTGRSPSRNPSGYRKAKERQAAEERRREERYNSPLYQGVARKLGIKNINSSRDIAQIEAYLRGGGNLGGDSRSSASKDDGGGNEQVDELAQQIQAQIEDNTKKQSVYEEMIDDLNRRIAEAEAARPSTGINVIVSKDEPNKDVEQQTTKKITNRKNLLALEDEEEVDTDTAALAAGTGINLGI